MPEETNSDTFSRTHPAPESCCAARRQWLQGALCAAVAGITRTADAATAPAKAPPQPGDVLCFPSWEQNRPVTLADLTLNGPPLVVYPRDPPSGVIREKSRLNQILLLMLDPTGLDRIAQRYALDGVVAYSGVCTHAACAVSEWKAAEKRLACPCHGSEFDVMQHAGVVAGPAPRALPLLPLKLADGQFVVNGKFSGKVGLKKV